MRKSIEELKKQGVKELVSSEKDSTKGGVAPAVVWTVRAGLFAASIIFRQRVYAPGPEDMQP